MKLEIAGIGIKINNYEGIEPVLPNNYNNFLSSNGKIDIEINWSRQKLPVYSKSHKIFDTDRTWNLFKDGKKRIIEFTPQPYSVRYTVGIFDSCYSKGDLFTSIDTKFPLSYPMDEVLMVNYLAQGHGVLVHALGVDYKGKGLLFIGSSGAGKSTLADLWKEINGVKLLSDDRIIIRKKNNNFWIYGTPWHGDANILSSQGAQLKKIFFLGHGFENKVGRIKGYHAFSNFVTTSFLTHWDHGGMCYSLDFIKEIYSNMPIFSLKFLPDKSVINFILRGNS